MLKTRVIPALLLRDDALVKTVKFSKHGYIGDPINTVRIFNELEVDELVFLDILLNNYLVCTVPGSGFGMSGSGHIRISYANEINTVIQGLELFQNALKKFM